MAAFFSQLRAGAVAVDKLRHGGTHVLAVAAGGPQPATPPRADDSEHPDQQQQVRPALELQLAAWAAEATAAVGAGRRPCAQAAGPEVAAQIRQLEESICQGLFGRRRRGLARCKSETALSSMRANGKSLPVLALPRGLAPPRRRWPPRTDPGPVPTGCDAQAARVKSGGGLPGFAGALDSVLGQWHLESGREALARDALWRGLLKGNADAAHTLGVQLLRAGRSSEHHGTDDAAIPVLRHAAALGSAAAMHDLAVCHLQGVGVARDRRQSVEFLRRAAALGLNEAVLVLSSALLQGSASLGIEARPEEGFALLRRYAEEASAGATAVYNLGICYEHAIGTECSMERAEQCYHRAAATGHRAAQHNLAVFLSQGKGKVHDPERAERLFRLAAQPEPDTTGTR